MPEAYVQRRLAAILAADVVGYSAMMEHAQEATYTWIDKLRRQLIEPSLARHEGRLIKTTGDGFFAEFASPVAALRCAIDIQDLLSSTEDSLRLRVGLNLGDVIVDQQGDVYGDGINIAARLEGIADPGGILISGKVYGEVEGNLDTDFEDRGEQWLKNIHRPIRAYAVRTRNSHGVGSALSTAEAASLHVPNKPSIAVLPFQNISGDSAQEYFADGIVEDIITALSRFRSLLILARNTSFTYKGKAVDIRRVGSELGVRYVLEGSVRKAGGRVRITGQLIDAETGAHLWADKIDGALEDVFDLQDQVTSNIVGAIASTVELAETERTKRKPTANLDSYDLCMRGSHAVWEGRLKEAISYFKQAIEKDDRYAEAYGHCAATYATVQAYWGVAISSEDKVEAIRFANIAATLGTDDAMTLARAARALVYFDKQYERAMAMADRAVALNPNLASMWLIRGWVLRLSGRPEESIKSFSRALQFSEFDPARIGAYCGISYGCFMLGRYEEGCVWAAKALQKHENALYLIPLIANGIRAGREDEVRTAVARLLQVAPGIRVSRLKELTPLRSGVESYGQALVEAGVPE
ncbi:adenylate/guanylate cyclase domain-containing protein [Bradyrhizobium genosp. P]|uniref:adenylate/guanylate cyclase domain-containing protein n=1 Tax=Bradyrhizobium genosp. P TaxID=83641 RepID=UPI003CFB08CF